MFAEGLSLAFEIFELLGICFIYGINFGFHLFDALFFLFGFGGCIAFGGFHVSDFVLKLADGFLSGFDVLFRIGKIGGERGIGFGLIGYELKLAFEAIT